MLHKKNIIRYLSCIIIFFFLSLLNSNNLFSEPGTAAGFEAAKTHFKKGFIFFNRMQYLSAVEYFRKAVAIYPEYYTAREFLARSYKLAGFLNESMKEWETIAGMTSNNVSIMNKLDTLRYRLSAGAQEKFAIGSKEYVFSAEYKSLNMGRYRFSKPIDMAIDPEKNMYLTSFNSGKLVKLNLNGDGMSIFERTSARFYGVDYMKNRVCVSDFKGDVVHILDKNLNLVKSLGSSGGTDGQFHGPKGICFDDSGFIYIADSGNHRVQKFDKDGNFILKFGEPGEYEAQLNSPSSVLINNNIVYVTDTGNKRIACFDDSGNFIKNITVSGMEMPRGISFYNNNIIISDEKAGLLFYSLEDNVSSGFSSWNNGKKTFSKLIAAHGDRDGLLYCLDYNHESVFIFSPLESVYSNLDIEITSIDVNKYPVLAFYMNIRNRDGKPVYNLDRKNFTIVEDNATAANINVDYLKNENPSASFVLCIDRSDGIRGYHNDIPWVAEFILKKMRKNDSLQVLNFNKDSWVGNDFDWSELRALKAIRNRSYSDGKAIDKVLYNAIGNLLPKINRRGVVIISDGSVSENSFEKYSPEIIIEYAKSHYIPVYFVVFKEKDPVLKRIAEETGGKIYRTSELDGLRSIYDNIRQSEEYRYVVVYSTYKTPSVKGWWSDVKIDVNYKGRRGIEWGGYFIP
jgi:DNA-binding beta-propeller fold protein YncE